MGKTKVCEMIETFVEVFGLCWPSGEGPDRHSLKFTFLNPRVRVLSEDRTEATSLTETEPK